MKATKLNAGLILVIFTISLFFLACNKKPEQVGLGLQPVSIELSVIFDDTTGLLSHSLREDSVRTDGNVIQTAMAGSMMDPVFGRTTAEIFSQFRLAENGHNFGTDPIFDSLVLSLKYSGFYGDSMSTQTIRVYELIDDLDPDTSYYSNQMFGNSGAEIGALTFTPLLEDSVNVGGTMQLPHLRISLSEDFAQKIITADASVFEDNDSWLEFMKGIHIESDDAASNGGIMLFDMFSSLTAMTIYYRSDDSEDTLSFSFLSNSNCARFTAFDHNDYLDASPEFRSQVIDGDTASGQQLLYLQGMGGVKAQLRLPDIQAFFDDGPVAINEAKLIFNIYPDGTTLEGPPQLAIGLINEEGDYLPLPDAGEASSYFGGYLNEAKTQYYFRISRHVQQVLTGESPNYPLALLASGGSFRANRVILFGPDPLLNGEQRMTLAIKYTRVN